eukprot:Hpha_TRINITY_DN13862_c0_g2::TRINITY_DN13862_c0_g2_i1::g.70155::m.70155
MCNTAELVDLKRELDQLQGHYKEIGKSLDTLSYMGDAAQELDERLQALTRAAAQGKRGKSSHAVSTVSTVLVDADTHNGFDLPLACCKFGSNPLHASDRSAKRLHQVETFVSELAGMCQSRGDSAVFCDPTPVPLVPPVAVARPGLPSTAAEMEKWVERLKMAAELDQERESLVYVVLDRVQIWRRLSKVLRRPVMFGRGNSLLEGKPLGQADQADAVHTLPKFEQGLLQDSWFQLALALVAMRRGPLANLFVSAEHKDVGLYVFQFYASRKVLLPTLAPGDEDGWRTVIVDDLMPCTPAVLRHDGKVRYGTDFLNTPGSPPVKATSDQHHTLPLFGLTDQEGEMWAALVEKAYAKFLGGYSRLHKGDTADAVHHLTGGQVTVLQWDSKAVTPATLALLWWHLEEGSRLRLLQAVQKSDDNVAAGRPELVKRESPLEWPTGDAIITTCALTSAQLRDWGVDARARSGARLVKLRTLRGTEEWDGDWSHTSPLWKPPARAFVNYGSMDEYITWMNITDFAQQYNTLLLCVEYAQGPSSFYRTLPSSSPASMRRHAEQFSLKVLRPNPSFAPPPVSPRKSPRPNILTPHHEPTRQPSQLTHDTEADTKLTVHIYCSHADRDSSPDEFNRNRVYGTDGQACGLQVRLFKASSIVEPTLHLGEGVSTEDEWRFDKDAARERLEAAQDSAAFEWPTDNEVELTKTNEGNHFVHRWSVDLEPGDYVATVCQQGFDWKYDVPFFLAFWNSEDDGGLTSSPFPGAMSPQRDRSHHGHVSSNRSVPKSRSGNEIKCKALGSAIAPSKVDRENFVALVGT